MPVLTITHYGTPVMWLETGATAQGLTGPVTAVATADRIAFLSPQGLELTVVLPSEIVAHLGSLPGLWLVTASADGAILSGEAVTIGGAEAAAVMDLFPDDRRPPSAALRHGQADAATMRILDDGVFAVVRGEFGDPVEIAGGACPALPAVWHQLRQALRSIPDRDWDGVVVVPAGGFFLPAIDADRIGLEPSTVDRRVALMLRNRLDSASATLRGLVLDGAPVGEHLLGVLEKVSVLWAADDGGGAGGQPWGWDAAARSVVLPTDADPVTDALRLAAGLYHAHACVSGDSLVTKIATGIIDPRAGMSFKTSGPSYDEIVSGFALEAGYASLLMDTLSPQLDVAEPELRASTFSIEGVERVAGVLRHAILPHAKAFLDAAQAFQDGWLDVRRRSILPRPPRSEAKASGIALPSLFRDLANGGGKPPPVEISNFRCTLPGPAQAGDDVYRVPLLTYAAPAGLPCSPVVGVVTVLVDSRGTGQISFEREDRVLLLVRISNRSFLSAVTRDLLVSVVCVHPDRRDLGQLMGDISAGNLVPPGETPYMNQNLPVMIRSDIDVEGS